MKEPCGKNFDWEREEGDKVSGSQLDRDLREGVYWMGCSAIKCALIIGSIAIITYAIANYFP